MFYYKVLQHLIGMTTVIFFSSAHKPEIWSGLGGEGIPLLHVESIGAVQLRSEHPLLLW